MADVKPNALFSDGAVLQRGQVVPVWGTADEGEEVTIEFEKQKLTAKSQNGKWRVDLKSLEAGGPFTMKISGKNTLEIKNLFVGEVWVCSGQSNMETNLSRSDPKKEEQAKANFYKEIPPEIREAQFLSLSKSKNTAMTVTTDVGDANDIHPLQKQPVGHRLALAARAMAYGEKIEYSGPLYASMKVSGDAIELSFQHVGGGLVAKEGDLKGFTIAGADGKFVPAKAVIQGDKIVVSANDVKSPKAARYGWANVPDVNLYNKEGLPASPFRTDVQ